MRGKLVILGLMLFAGTSISQAGWLDNTLKSVTKGLSDRAVNDTSTGVNDAGNSAYEAAKGKVRDAVTGKPADGQNSPPQGSPSGGAEQVSPSNPVQMDTVQGAPGSALTMEAETVYTKFDFIPGDKMIFFDDFSDTDVGEFPRKWHINGPKGGNNVPVEVAEYQGKRFLRNVPSQKGQRQHDSTQYIRLTQKGDLPEKFTIEFDAMFSNAIVSKAKFPNEYYLYLVNEKTPYLGLNRKGMGKLILSGKDNMSFNTVTNLDLQDENVHHISVSVNGTFVKGYVDNIRVINDPEGLKRPVTMIGLGMTNRASYMTDKLMITNFRLAEGGKEIKSALDTEGKIITHGILFDTGMATIKSESLPTLKMILGLLNDDPNLKFSIEGHTDNQGNRGINQPLSENRAASVRTWLEGKGVDQFRLTTAGFGDTKPIDTNKTPEGRANNRRVEFVKF